MTVNEATEAKVGGKAVIWNGKTAWINRIVINHPEGDCARIRFEGVPIYAMNSRALTPTEFVRLDSLTLAG